MLKKHSSNHYKFGFLSKHGWKQFDDDYKKAKLLLSQEWVLTNFPNINNDTLPNEPKTKENDEKQLPKPKKDDEKQTPKPQKDDKKQTLKPKKDDEKQPSKPAKDDDNITSETKQIDEKQPEPAPPIILLQDHEMFKDEDGNRLNIEVRGEREYNKCFFKVSDVSKAFKMDKLNVVLLNKDKGYQLNKHYITFIEEQFNKGESLPNKTVDRVHPTEQRTPNKTFQKRLFLTYNGILKVLFSSRSGIAEHFQEWASRILFTVQIGTIQQKEQLFSDILGVNL